MSNSVSAEKKERSKIFETVLRSPGMSGKCKIVLNLSRQNIIFLSRLIENGMDVEKNGSDDQIIAALPKESLDELRLVPEEILKKGDLLEFYERLKSL